MTPAERIDAALALLAPPEERREECRRDIAIAISWVHRTTEFENASKVFHSKAGRAQVKAYGTALRRVLAANAKIDPQTKPWFLIPSDPERGSVLEFIKQEIKKADDLLKANPIRENKRDDARLIKSAVAMAKTLLVLYCREASCTRNGPWARLAKLLAGRSTDVFGHMCAYRKHPKPVIRKLKYPDGSFAFAAGK